MFWGEFSHRLDSKGRVIIPAPYRPYLSEGAILTRGIDRHLVIYPHDVWDSVAQQLNRLSIADPTARALRRLVFSGAIPFSLDNQGRVLIPSHLRDYAALNGSVVVVGIENSLELWQPERWHAALNGVSHTLAESGHELPLGL